MMKKILTDKRLIVLLHVLVWLILFIIPTYLLYFDSSRDLTFLLNTYIQTVLYAVLFYLSYLWVVPRFFFGNKRFSYVLILVSSVIVATVILEVTTLFFPRNQGIAPPHPPMNATEMPREMPMEMPRMNLQKPIRHGPSPGWPTYNFILTSLLVSAFALGLRFSQKMIQNEKEKEALQKEKLFSELAFLKNQINPHFFFNTLNNIYSLVETSVSDGQKAILQLSKLMRYLLYETDKESLELDREIEFMEHYINLMKLRLSSKVELQVILPAKNTGLQIAPLLFLPFIENAFKHGISYSSPSFIHITMRIHEDAVSFECSNSLGGKGEEMLKTAHGIGLENVKKRLALLFPDRHTLDIHATETAFRVFLTIRLTNNSTP